MKFKLGKAKPAAEAPLAAARPHRAVRRLPPRDLLLLVLAAALLYGAAAGLFVWQQGQSRVEATARTQAAALALAERLAERMRAYRKELERLAADGQLAALIAAGDDEALRGQEATIAAALKDALHVRLLPPGWEPRATPELEYMSFASLEIVRSAERTAKPSLFELHRHGSPHRHIALAVPVVAAKDQPVAGVIHLALPADLVQRTLEGEAFQGKWAVRQIIGNKPLPLAEGGRSPGADGKEDGKEPVGGTLWELAYWYGEVTVGPLQYALYFGPPTLLLLLLGLVRLRRMPVVAADQAGTRANAEQASDAFDGFGVTTVSDNGHQQPETPNMSAKGLLARLLPRKKAAAASSAEKPAAAKEEIGMPPPPCVPVAAELVVEEAEVSLDLEPEPPPARPAAPPLFPEEIFRAYDIRGIVGETLTRPMVYELGRAIGSTAYDKGQQTVIVARDGRLSGEELISALAGGLRDSGRDVVDLGVVPTPVLYFATHVLGSNSGVMLTGSHNAPRYNGLKIVLNGEALAGKAIRALGQRVADGDLLQGEGVRQERNLVPDYIKRISGEVKLVRPLKIVVDCGNGVAGVVAPALLRALGCEVIELYCEVDGNFPHHHPDPGQPQNLQDLIRTVQAQGADLGLAFDGDGDRLGVVDSAGHIIWPDRLLMLLAADVLARHPGADILYDVKSSRNLAGQILALGGSPQMCATGHSLIKARMKETGALLAGEMSGHIFYKERWYGFDDALYAGARLLELLAADARDSAAVFAELPDSVNTPELYMPIAEGDKFPLVRRVIEEARFAGEVRRATLDGLRVEFEDGWGLVRASNTAPALIFRFEADDAAGLEQIQGLFREQLLAIDPRLALPF